MPANRRLNRILLDVGTPVPIALPDNYVIFGYSGSMELLFTSSETTTDITWIQLEGSAVTYNTGTTNVTKIDFSTTDLIKKKWRVYTNKGRAFERSAEGWFLHYPVEYITPNKGNSTILDYPGINLNYKYIKGLFTKAESNAFRIPTITGSNQSGLLNDTFNVQAIIDSVFYMEVYKLVTGSWVLDYSVPYYTHQLPINDNTDYKIVVAYSDKGRYYEKSQIVLVASDYYRKNYIIDNVKANIVNSTSIIDYTTASQNISSESIVENIISRIINSTNIIDYVAQLQSIVATPLSQEQIQSNTGNSTELQAYTVTLQTSTGVI